MLSIITGAPRESISPPRPKPKTLILSAMMKNRLTTGLKQLSRSLATSNRQFIVPLLTILKKLENPCITFLVILQNRQTNTAK